MKRTPLRELHALGQSLWLDDIRRDLIGSGELRRLIVEDGVRGLTSNPAIFEKSITGSGDYDAEIRTLAHQGADAMAIYEALTQGDVQRAADEFVALYRATDAADGYVSLEVNPRLAHDSRGTIIEARRLWAALDRPNVMIKVPATIEGLVAIRELTREGINVNATLLFGLSRYRQTAEAYVAGLEARAAQGVPLRHVASVASFFVSRIDQAIDPRLDACIARGGEVAEWARAARGQAAIASARCAYQIYREVFEGDRFRSLAGRSARTQRTLWASTTPKNPGDVDVKYVEALIGGATVNTVTMETLRAYRDHGAPRARIEEGVEEARLLLSRLPRLGIVMDEVAQQLEAEGIEKFTVPFDKLLRALNATARSCKGATIS